ncbi:recombinase family protein [Streptomyces sp. NPDC089799]|uniref:recombinase family protein n=1 Tax=Streptomyces sp. NPDC089799 TaxID=3155066 RepID=UPI003415CAC0
MGYARVSTGGQKLDRQYDALKVAGCRRIFTDKKYGKNDLRSELKACHARPCPPGLSIATAGCAQPTAGWGGRPECPAEVVTALPACRLRGC